MTEPRHVQVVVGDTMPVGYREYFGTGRVDGEETTSPAARGKRCYELAALALLEAPSGTLLTHGSIHGPAEDNIRIGHGWLVIPTASGRKLVWEPLHACIYDRDEWYAWSRARDERSYSLPAARKILFATGHYGRWHDSRYP